MKKQIRLMSAALAACMLLTAGGAPAFAAEGAQEHNYTILREITDDTDFMWFPEGETMRFEQDGKYGLKKLDGTVVLPAVYSDIDFPLCCRNERFDYHPKRKKGRCRAGWQDHP